MKVNFPSYNKCHIFYICYLFLFFNSKLIFAPHYYNIYLNVLLQYLSDYYFLSKLMNFKNIFSLKSKKKGEI